MQGDGPLGPMMNDRSRARPIEDAWPGARRLKRIDLASEEYRAVFARLGAGLAK
jgi:hypothetical protein